MSEKRKSERIEKYCRLIRNQKKMEDKRSKPSDDESDELQELLQSAAQAAGINVSNLEQMFQSRSTRPGKYDYIMTNLSSENKTECMIALQELSEILSIATEDLFLRSGSGLDSTAIVSHLIRLISDKPDIYSMDGELQPEIVLLCCRCLYNLIDVNPIAVGLLAQQNGVEALVEKLLEIEFIDLAEQILKVLEKVSLEHPNSIIKSDAMMASLQYLDFFGIHVQRTAMSIISNTMEALPSSGPSVTSTGQMAYTKISGVIDIIVRLVSYGDQKIVDYAIGSVGRIADWAGKDASKLPQLVTKEHLKSVTEALQHSSDYKQTTTNKMFLLVCKAIANIVKKCPAYGGYFVNELDLLTLIRNIIVDGSASDIEVGLNTFAVHRPADQSIAILEILTELLPGLPSKDVWRIGPPKAEDQLPEEVIPDEEALEKYLKVIVPLLADVFMMTSNTTIRKKIVYCIAKPVWFSNNVELLSDTLKGCKKLGKLLYELIHTHHTCIGETSKNANEERMMVYTGLTISSIIIEKCGNHFRDWFIREGFKNELVALSEKAPEEDEGVVGELNGTDWMLLYQDEGEISPKVDKPEESSSQVQPESTHTERLEKVRLALKKETAQRNVLVGWTTERFSEANLMKKIFLLGKQVRELISQDEDDVNGSERITRLLDLQQEITTIGTLSSDTDAKSKIKKCFEEIVQIIKIDDQVTGTGITNYELFSSDLTEFLIDFLTSKGNDEDHEFENTGRVSGWCLSLSERLSIFMETMCAGIDGSNTGFASLVTHLNEHLSRLEKYPVLSAITQDYGMYFGAGALQILSQVTRQMRLKIAPREGTTVPPNLQNLQISIPAVSSFNVLISYIKARMNATGDSSAMEGDVNVTDDERESDEESEIEIHDELDETPVEEKTINLAGSPEKKRSIPTRSSNTPATPVSNLVIYYNDEPVPIGGTVFGTIYQSLPKPVVVSTAVWNTTHSVTFGYDVGSAKKNFHSPKKTGLGCSCHVCSLVYPHIGIDRTDSHTNEFARPLLLLTLMNALNSRYEYIASAFVSQVSESAFLNNKLTAKIAKQLAEPIMTISAIHPDWSWSLMYNSWFLFPFETRLKFLRCTGLGNSRNLVNWLQYHKPSSAESSINLSPLTRTDRLKVKIARKGIFEALVKVIGLIGEKISMLEVEFLNEVGSGLGPTLEFFALVSEAVRKREGVALKSGCPRIPIWRTEESDSSSDMLNPLHGLYPAPMDPRSTNQNDIKEIFKTLGAFVAKAFLDSRHLDLSFHWVFLEQIFHGQNRDQNSREYRLLMVKSINSRLYSSLKQLLDSYETLDMDELMLDFTLPGYPNYELIPNGSDIAITKDNLQSYVDAVIDATVGSGVQTQIQSFKQGFETFIPCHFFDCFSVDDIGMIIGGEGNENWNSQVLRDAFKADHGYNANSRIILQLSEMLADFTADERRCFLSFCTGSPKLPIGGFSSLHPPLTIVCKTVAKNEKPDDCLPSVMTCAHYLKVPEYSSAEIMKEKFLYAMKEGQNSFHLS